jgi:hypothetical protein
MEYHDNEGIREARLKRGENARETWNLMARRSALAIPSGLRLELEPLRRAAKPEGIRERGREREQERGERK